MAMGDRPISWGVPWRIGFYERSEGLHSSTEGVILRYFKLQGPVVREIECLQTAGIIVLVTHTE